MLAGWLAIELIRVIIVIRTERKDVGLSRRNVIFIRINLRENGEARIWLWNVFDEVKTRFFIYFLDSAMEVRNETSSVISNIYCKR